MVLRTSPQNANAVRLSRSGIETTDNEDAEAHAACSPIRCCKNAEDAEEHAALLAVKMMAGMGYTQIVLELDCATAVSALQAAGPDRSESWVTIDETKKSLKDAYNYSINHVRRGSNRAVDVLAKLARAAGSCIWIAAFHDPF
ncbi:hypothetical protein ACQ4PT_039474 [Festuca glaucescens]